MTEARSCAFSHPTTTHGICEQVDMIKNAILKYFRSNPKKLCDILVATNVKSAVFETRYGDLSVPVNSKSMVRTFLKGDYFGERPVLRFLALKSTASTLLNIGANVGITARVFQELSNYDVVKCFEPDPENFAGLKVNCGGYAGTELYNTAIGSEKGVLSLKLNPKSVGRHSFKTDFAMGAIDVPVETLSRYVDPDEPFDIFMDVEGWEIEALKGARSFLNNCHLCALEWNEHMHGPAEKQDMQQIMIEAGFTKLSDLNDGSMVYEITELANLKGQRDIVFLRGEAHAIMSS